MPELPQTALENTVADGRWLLATQRLSPNHDARPEGIAIRLVVLHHISLPAGCFQGEAVCELFENRLSASAYPDAPELSEVEELRVSAHFFIRRDGTALQFVNCNQRAWHAGISSWRGQPGCNHYSIGIELEGDAATRFTDTQYIALNALLDALVAAYPIEAVTAHSEIALGRKIDPGARFDWSRLARRWGI